MRLEDLALIGNCQFSALVSDQGSVAWCCLPRFDSEPVFASLLDEQDGGRFAVTPEGGGRGVQRYLENTNVLETRFSAPSGSFRVIDFAPRFALFGRTFRPTQLIRIVEPLEGTPRIRVQCDPRLGFGKGVPKGLVGSHHVRYEGFASQLRLTTDVPLSYLGGQPFTLTTRRHLVLAWGAPVEEELAPLCERFLEQTVAYWIHWVKQSNIPPLYQVAVIRSALALKLHCFEDTGAIVAAMTTSIPEAPASSRTWDYRYCWLRDAYYSLGAFRLLGHFEERESFVHFLLDVAGSAPDLRLQPLYRIDGRADLDEAILADWPGYEGHGPVRIGNAAAKHVQNDIFGEMVLALAPIFLDERFQAERSRAVIDLLTRLARKAIAVSGTPDAGIWEYRTEWQPQTFSGLMCWAGADRMARVAKKHAPSLAAEFASASERIRKEIEDRAWNQELGSFAGSYGGRDLDAALLQMASLRFLGREDPKLVGTIDRIQQHLTSNGWLQRYRLDDGFGRPEVAFLLCTFWLIEALAFTGRMHEAQTIMERAHSALTPLGLLSEDIDPTSLRLWGNFPQAYSHVGLIHAAFAASPRWAEIL